MSGNTNNISAWQKIRQSAAEGVSPGYRSMKQAMQERQLKRYQEQQSRLAEIKRQQEYYGRHVDRMQYSLDVENRRADAKQQKMLGENIAALEKEIADLEKQEKQEDERLFEKYKTFNMDKNFKSKEDMENQHATDYGNLEKLKTTIANKKEYLKQVKELQNGPVALLQNYNDEEATTGWAAYQNWEKTREEYRKQAAEAEKNKPWYEKVAGAIIASQGTTTDSNVPNANLLPAMINAYREDTSYQEPNDDWNEDMKKRFGYLFLKNPQQAWDYAKSVNDLIAQAKEAEKLEDIKVGATVSGQAAAGHTAAAIVAFMLGGADFLDDLAQFVGRGEIAANANVSPLEYSQAVIGGIGEHLNEEYGTLNEDIPVIGGKGWGDVYGLLTSVAQSATAGYLGGPIGTGAIFFGSAAAQGVDDALARGATGEQAMAYGTMMGLAEAIPEALSIHSLLEIGDSATLKEFFVNVLKQGGEEFLEEGVTSALGLFADNLVMQDKSEYNALAKKYREQGMSATEANKKAWMDMAEGVAFDVLSGFLSGSLHAAPHTGVQTIQSKIANKRAAATADRAQKNTTSNEGGVSYSISQDSQGDFVKINTDQELFDGKATREMQEIARKTIRDRFKGLVLPVGKEKAYINKRSADEYAYPANRRMDETVKESKMRASSELDNLLSVSKFIENRTDDGRHPQATGGWDVYQTRFEIGGIMFDGEVQVMVTDHGRVFYDITKIRRSPVNGGQTENNSVAASGNLPTPIISQPGAGVNQGNSSMFDLSAAAPDKDAVQKSIERAAGYQNLTEEQRKIKSIAQAFGVNVIFDNLDKRVKNYETGQMEMIYPDGYYDEATNTIYINTSDKGPVKHQPVAYIFKHELTHYLETNEHDYALLWSDIMNSSTFKEYVAGKGYDGTDAWAAAIIEQYKQYDQAYRSADGNAVEYRAKREMVANFVGDMLFGGRQDIAESLLAGMEPEPRKTFLQKIQAIFTWLKNALKRHAYGSEMEKLERQFLEVARNVAKKENATRQSEGGRSYSFNNTVSGMANDQLQPYDEEMTAIFERNGDFIVDSREKLEMIVDLAFDEPSKKATAYFGILSAKILSKIEKSVPNIPKELGGTLFKENQTYSVAATLDSIRHLVDDRPGMTRSDVIDYLDRMADTIIDNDSVTFDWYVDDRGQKSRGLLFKKEFSDGITQSFEIISSKKRSLKLQTMYMGSGDYIKKKTATTPPMQKAPAHTFETRASQSSNTSISENDPGVNGKISYSVPTTDVDSVLDAVRRGDMTNEEAKQLLGKKKTLNPVQIAQLKPEDADTTPDLDDPKREGDGDGESKLHGSVQGSPIIIDELKERIKDNTYIKNYGTTTNKETLQEAMNELDKGGAAYVRQWERLDPKRASAVDVAAGLILLQRYQDAGMYDDAEWVVEKLRDIGTAAGQTVQIFSIIGRFTPEMMVHYARKTLDKAIELLDMKKIRTNDWIKKNRSKFELTDEEVETIRNHVLAAQDLEDGSRQKSILLAEICTIIQNKIPPESGQSIRALQRISLLLNVKTNIRNFLGNQSMIPLHISSDFFGGLIEQRYTKKFGTNRTMGVSMKTFGEAYVQGKKKGYYETLDDFRRGIRTKQEELNRFDTNNRQVAAGKSFNEHHNGKLAEQLNALARALNRMDDVTSMLLELGDRPFYEMWFMNSLNNQMRMNKVENGIPTSKMVEIATQEALQRTWQDNNAVTRTMSQLRDKLNVIRIPRFRFNGKTYSGTSYGFGDFVIKFVKTPSNIAKAMWEFSPLGFITAAHKGSELYEAFESGRLTPQMQHEAARSWGAAITGTLLYALVALAVATGALELSGAGDDDKDVSNFEKYIVGIPPYSMKIFGQNVTYSWNQPLGAVLATIADIIDSNKEGEEDLPWTEDLWNGFVAGATVFTEQSFLMSLYELFSAEGGIAAGVSDAFLSEPSAFIPAVLSQVASFLDPYRRMTYVNGEPLMSSINSILYRIPGLRNTLPVQVNVLGEKAENVQYLNPWSAFFAPGNRYPESSGQIAEEIYELYKLTEDPSVMPRTAPNSFKVKGQTINFTPEEKAEMQRSMGQISVGILGEMFASDAYAKLTDEQKVKAVSQVYSYAFAKAKTLLDYDYEVMAEMQGGQDVLTPQRWNRLNDQAKQILVDEYFLSNAEQACREDDRKLADLFTKKAKEG